MRFLIALVICLALLWVTDLFFFKGQYSNRLWLDTQYELQKINGDIRRFVRF
jgi:hypothetical protein